MDDLFVLFFCACFLIFVICNWAEASLGKTDTRDAERMYIHPPVLSWWSFLRLLRSCNLCACMGVLCTSEDRANQLTNEKTSVDSETKTWCVVDLVGFAEMCV